VKYHGHESAEVSYATARGAAGAAFFDIDGTLLARPSLEQRFFWHLQRQGKIPAGNYLHWLAQTLRPGLRDLRAAAQANKCYLRGVHAQIFSAFSAKNGAAFPGTGGPEFFPAAIQRLWWHALRGDAIVLVSGTLTPLAQIVRLALERELLWRGVDCKIFVIATNLEMNAGCYTGKVSGAAIFGERKALAVKEFAGAQNISLAQSSAYGDSSLDGWMLGVVGHAFAVNPGWRLRRIARLRGWQILSWTHCALRTASEQRDLEKSLKLKRQAAR
jgi:HAD superfamily hydrolase (TIGR01490 family)